MACGVFLCVLLSATLFMAWTAHSSRRYIPLPTNVIIDYTDTSLQVNTAHLSRMLLPGNNITLFPFLKESLYSSCMRFPSSHHRPLCFPF